MAEATVIIHQERERMFEKRHPWVFSGAIRSVKGNPENGDIVTLRGESGKFLARGYWNQKSQIHVHILTWDEHQQIDEDFWRQRLAKAIMMRERFAQSNAANAYRLVNAENDMLPGLVVDRYGDWLVLQALTLGIDRHKQMLAKMLLDLMEARGVYERSDVDVRAKEGLNPVTGVLLGEVPPGLIEIVENGHHFLVDIKQGHKTGFYLDQRDNRAWLQKWLEVNANREQSLLNCFCYTGGFSLYALSAKLSEVISVDASADALALAKRNVELNQLNVDPSNFVEADVFDYLRELRSARRQFDVIVLDPPKFAQSQKQVEGALRGYKDINWLAFQLIKPGGLLLTFSCSGLVDADLFQKVVFGALVDAKREAQIIARLTAGSDHPVALTFPEGMYLKGLACRVW